ncbi:MAG: 50S ribosomal protein L19 [Candidatus Gottesmanbacteria bacterium]
MANQVTFGQTKFSVGDTVSVYYKIIESEKVSGVKKHEEKEEVRERLQPFEGTVISINNNKNFTVRKIAIGGIGVERIFSINSPWINKIIVKKGIKVRKAKLYYIRKNKKQIR